MKSDKKHKILYKWKLFIVDYIESFFCEENMIIIDIMIQDFYLPMLFKIVRLKRNLHKIHVSPG